MLIECSNITKSFQGIPLLKDITFKIDDHDKVAIIGVNGAGKTTILKIIAGEENYDSGDLFCNKELTLGYLKQQHDLAMDKTVYDVGLDVFAPLITIENRLRQLENEMTTDHSERILNEYDRLTQSFHDKDGYSYPSKLTGVLKGLGFSEEEFNLKVSMLSGGQKTRLALAKMLLQEPKLLLLDEPTNHLDMTSKEILENAINNYTGTVFYVSHDRYFINQTATRILELTNTKIINYLGNYDYYEEKCEELTKTYAPAIEKEKKVTSTSSGKQDYLERKAEAARTRKLKNDISKVEKEIKEKEDRLNELDELLADPAVSTNSAKLNEISKEQNEISERLDELMDQWEILSDQLD